MAAKVPQVQSVVGWGTLQTFQRFSRETQENWRHKGYLALEDQGSSKGLRLSLNALDALEKNVERLDVLRAMRGLGIPVLLIHGRDDQTVPLSEGMKLWQCADPKLSRLYVVEDAGHTFRTQHPFRKPSRPLIEAVMETTSWFERTL